MLTPQTREDWVTPLLRPAVIASHSLRHPSWPNGPVPSPQNSLGFERCGSSGFTLGILGSPQSYLDIAPMDPLLNLLGFGVGSPTF